MTRRRLIIFLAAPFVATVLLLSLTVVPGGLRAWVSIAFFSIWVVWGYLAVLARPGMLPPAPDQLLQVLWVLCRLRTELAQRLGGTGGAGT